MTLEQELYRAVSQVKTYFFAERIVLTATDPLVRYLATRMMFRKIIDIFPELNTRPLITEVKSEFKTQLPKPRLVKR